MPNYVNGVTGQQCAALSGENCTLPVSFAAEFGAERLPDGKCGMLETDPTICPAFRTNQEIWTRIAEIARNFTNRKHPGGER